MNEDELYYAGTLPEVTVTAKMSPKAREKASMKY